STSFFKHYGDHRHLHSFPTRRSSDLKGSGNASVGMMCSTISHQESEEPSSKIAKPRSCITSAVPVKMDSPSAFSPRGALTATTRSEEHTSELQSRFDLVCRLLLEKKK